jgi:RNA polymerase sigma factor (sigma-70 family)
MPPAARLRFPAPKRDASNAQALSDRLPVLPWRINNEGVTVDDQGRLADQFEEHRTHLRAIAYRMLGSLSEADDAVQEAWLRLSRAEVSGVENLQGWLTPVVARLSVDMLRTRQARRAEPFETRMPEPIVSRESDVDPEHEALLAARSASRCWWCLKRLPPPNGLRLCCTTCSLSPSMKSRQSSDARRPRRVRGASTTDLGLGGSVLDAAFC